MNKLKNSHFNRSLTELTEVSLFGSFYVTLLRLGVNSRSQFITHLLGQEQLTVKGSSNRTLPRFEEPILG